MLAAIPSVILGLWGILVLVPAVRSFDEWVLDNFGKDIPLLSGPPFGIGFLTAGIILSIMILPIITSLSREMIRAVPKDQSEAMLALGATRWEAIRGAVLPYCRSGLLGAIILGMARAMGETMAVAMVIGNSYDVTTDLFNSGSTISSWLAGHFGEASPGSVEEGALIELALVLLGMSLFVNILARLMVQRMSSGLRVRT